MPRLRGVELSLVAGFGSRAVPEYPHPDASSVCVRPLANREHPLNSDGQTQLTAVSPAPQDSGLSFKKSHARVSVYVSSTPENEFRLRYAIDNSPAPAKIIFFKLLMNGRHIVSWGIDTTQRNEGTVARALYHPSTKQDNKRASREQPTTRIESRYFHFAPEREPKSAAEDGGLIEVRVFRCKGRQRVAAVLDHYRDQEKYGIASPSGGILDRPEDTCFYDYHLLDAKDSPYATFLFHYRSMKYLEQLNLIPALQQGSQSSRSDEASYRNHKSTPSVNSGSQSHGPAPTRLLPELEHPRNTSHQSNNTFHPENIGSTGHLRSGQVCQSFKETTGGASPDPSVDPEYAFTDQDEQHSQSSARSRGPSRSSSVRSSCPSLTPSLIQYTESAEFMSEEIQLGVAQALLIPRRTVTAVVVEAGAGRPNVDMCASEFASSDASHESPVSHGLPSAASGLVPHNHVACDESKAARLSILQGKSTPSTPGKMAPSRRDKRLSPTLARNMPEAVWLKNPPSAVVEARSTIETDHSLAPARRAPTPYPVEGNVLPATLASEPEPAHEMSERGSTLVTEMPLRGRGPPLGNWI